MPRSEAPYKEVDVWTRLNAYSLEYGLSIDHHLDHKVEWMEKHGGLCFCDWESGRVCPCENVMSDLNKYNGQCLCGLLCTEERLDQKEKQRKNKKEHVIDKKKNREKAKETKSLFNRLFLKNK